MRTVEAPRQPATIDEEQGLSALLRNPTTLTAFALLSLCSAVFVATRLGSQSFWIDETLTIQPVLDAHDLRSLVNGVVAADTQPPASHFVLYALRDLLPLGEYGLRLPSFLYVQASILIGFFAVRRYWDTGIAILFACYCEISPLLAFYAAEARNYGLWLLLSVSGLALFARWLGSVGLLDKPPDRRAMVWSIALGIVNAAGLWTHLFHVFAVGSQIAATIVIAVFRGPRRIAPGTARIVSTSGAVSLAVTVVAFLPWVVVLLREVAQGHAGVPWTRPFGAMNLLYYTYAAHFGMSLGPNLIDLHVKPFSRIFLENPKTIATAGTVVSGTAAVYSVLAWRWVTHTDRRWQLVPLALMPAAMIVPLVVYGATTAFPIHIRHFLYAWPVLPLVLSIGALRTRYGGLVYIAAFAAGLISTVSLFTSESYAKDDTRGAVAFAEKNSNGNVVILGEAVPFYCSTADCRPREFHEIEPDTDHLWLLYNRGWTSANRKKRDRLARAAYELGFRRIPVASNFHGIELMHWSREQP